ncbi:hypothetical protein U0R10_00360 [Aquirufa sp. OSTEICH-129V]|uniref:Uncharacterized protein n=1 Tax=Aquirufa avitistagni TaxID=3104728 RepID=A0ABW6DA94_9BACT
MSNDINFKPDWHSYNNMDNDERQARYGLIKLLNLYTDGKISYEKYISEVDNSFYFPYLSDVILKEISDHKKSKEVVKISAKLNSSKNKQFVVKTKVTFSHYLMILMIIISFIAFIIGISHQ